MKRCRLVLFVLISTTLLGCAISQAFRDIFVNNYDGAGHFTSLVYVENGTLAYVDSLNAKVGFDAVCVLHVTVFDHTGQDNIQDELYGMPEVHYSLPYKYISSNEEVRVDVNRRGNLARWFKDYVHGDWVEGVSGRSYYDAMSVVAVKSQIGSVWIVSPYLRFRGDSYMHISIATGFTIDPGINYLGTLMIYLYENDYGELIGVSSHELLEGDRYSDMDFFGQHFPYLYKSMNKCFIMPDIIER